MEQCEEVLEGHANAIDRIWVLTASAMIFFMQAGFSLVESGSVRPKSNSNILIKNLFDGAIGAIGWYLVGYGFAFGEDSSGFVGTSKFAGTSISPEDKSGYYLQWLFQFTFCATSSTIVSGSLAERTYLETYLIYSLYMSAFVYPIIVHWVWHPQGWLAEDGMIDFAGSGVVHLVGGASGFIGAYIIGPRFDVFNEYSNSEDK